MHEAFVEAGLLDQPGGGELDLIAGWKVRDVLRANGLELRHRHDGVHEE